MAKTEVTGQEVSMNDLQQLMRLNNWAETDLRVKDLVHLLHPKGFSLVSRRPMVNSHADPQREAHLRDRS